MKTALRVAVSLLIAGALLVVLLRWGGVSLADVRGALGRLEWRVYGCALALHAGIYLLRAWRFRVLMEGAERGGFVAQLGVTLAYGMASIVLPAKVGELSYLVYAGRVLGVGAEQALAVLVVARVLDLATLALGMGAACGVVAALEGSRAPDWMGTAALAALGLALLLFLVAWNGRWLVRAGVWASRRMRVERWRVGARAVAKVESAGLALEQAARGRKMWGAVLLSVLAWLGVFGFCAVLAQGMGIGEVGFAQAVFGSGVAIVTSLLPLSAFASFGTLEAGWVVGFGVFGVGRDVALATGAGLHVVQLVNVVGLGVVGHVVMGVVARGRARK